MVVLVLVALGQSLYCAVPGLAMKTGLSCFGRSGPVVQRVLAFACQL